MKEEEEEEEEEEERKKLIRTVDAYVHFVWVARS